MFYAIYNNMEYIKDKHRMHLCMAHIVFCPKYRKPVLTDNVANRMEQIIYELAKTRKWDIPNLTIQPEHVHIFLRFNVKESPHQVVKAIKGKTSNQLWTRSYFFATAGNVSSEIIQKYIEEQKGK